MKSVKVIIAVIAMCLFMTGTGFAQEKANKESKNSKESKDSTSYEDNYKKSWLTYATESGIGIQFSGEVEIEFVNVEGEGGFSNQDLTVQKVKTRSPHIRIDKAILGTEIFYADNLTYKIELRFGDDGTRIDKHYARYWARSIHTVFELGKNRPFVARSRTTEGYPLLGTSYWKGREYHITGVTTYPLSKNWDIIGGLSVAMKRPLGTDDAAEDKSFKMLVSDDYETIDGQTIEYGVKGGLKAYGFTALGWYYYGGLIDDFDWKLQLSQNMQGYDALGDETDRTQYWYGGRVAFDAWNIHLLGEYIYSLDGLLPREGYYVEGAYNIPEILGIRGIMPFVRYGELNVEKHEAQLGNPNTWDRTMTNLALIANFNNYIFLKIEHYLIDEVTGGEAPEDQVDDDQTVVQLNFVF